VTFGGKAGAAGFYYTTDFKLKDLNISFEQNVDMVKIINYGIVWQTILRKNLLSYVMDTSTFLKVELGRVANEKEFIKDIRGVGTFIGFDL